MDRAVVGERRQRGSEHPFTSLKQLLHRPRGREQRGRCRIETRNLHVSCDFRPPDVIELLEQTPREIDIAGDVLSVFGVALHAPVSDEDERRQPGGHEIRQHCRLVFLESCNRVVSRDRRRRGLEWVRPAPHQRRKRDRKVAHERGVSRVSQIHNPADAVGIVEQHVVERQVVVDDLRAESGHSRGYVAVETIQYCSDELPPFPIGLAGQ